MNGAVQLDKFYQLNGLAAADLQTGGSRGYARRLRGAFQAGARSRVVNQHLTHDARRYRQKVNLVGKLAAGPVAQFQVSLVDQGSSLKRVIATLPAQMARSNPMQFVVQRRPEFNQRRIVSGPEPFKQVLYRDAHRIRLTLQVTLFANFPAGIRFTQIEGTGSFQIQSTERFMTHNHLRNSGVCGGVAIAIAISFIGFEAQAQTQTIAAPPVPAEIKVPAGNVAYLKADAVGTQNYVCLPAGSFLGWKFQAPQATLFLTYKLLNSEVRQQVTTHFLSPNPMEAGTPARATWQGSLDTSVVWAKRIAESSDPDFVAQGAIPWFLLQATGVQRGPADGALLAQTTYIQRVKTTGGVMPTTGCTEAGSIQFVPYTAEYVFYRSTGAR